MEPQMIDHYNEFPHSVNVIDKMNEELSEVQKELERLKEKCKMMNPYIPDFNIILICKEQLNDYLELFDKIRENIRDYLYLYKKEGVIADEEYDLKDLFENSNELIDILYNRLNENGSNLNISQEWCEYRIDNALDKFKPIVELQKYWWENMIKDDISDDIIEMIINYILEGNDYEVKLCDCVKIKCDKCNHIHSIDEGIIVKNHSEWKCWDCYSDSDDD